MVKEGEELTKLFDGLRNEFLKHKIDVGYRENYFPLLVKDPIAYSKFLKKELGADYDQVQALIDAKNIDNGGVKMTIEQEAQFISDVMRGQIKGVSLATIGNMKRRVFEEITPEMNKYYHDNSYSLINYINGSHEMIENRKFFNVGDPAKGYVHSKDAIGDMMLKLVQDKKLDIGQLNEARGVIEAMFDKQVINPIMGSLKNISYADILGDVRNAISQLADIGISAGLRGYRSTGKALVKVAFGKSDIKMKEIIGEDLLHEFGDNNSTHKVITNLLRWSGFHKADRIGKEVIMNSSIYKMQKDARKLKARAESGKGLSGAQKYERDVFIKNLSEYFLTKAERAKVINDLISGKITPEIKKLAYNKLLDVQPIAKSEMPQLYNKTPALRMFYSLKSYQLKVFDVYRNEVFSHFGKNSTPASRMFGAKKLTKLMVSMAVAGATIDELLDLMSGRKTPLSDRVAFGFMKIMGANPYIANVAKKEGLGSVVLHEVAPAPLLVPFDVLTRVYKEINGTGHGKLMKDIPIIGDEIYNLSHPKKDKR
ncbi:MAG: hypothetical protein IT212_07580 [Bacteroidia bacterium]|nr:hypothetical protein [Bacteroidia bacterium]